VTCHRDDEGEKFFRCRGVFKEATMTSPASICHHTWLKGPQVNIGTLRTHNRHKHWSMSGSSFTPAAGQQKMKSFFSVQKKRRTSASSDPAFSSVAEAAAEGNNNEAEADVQDLTDVNNITDAVLDGVITEQPVRLEFIPCSGINAYDYYPFSIHSSATRELYGNSNLIPKVDWTVDSLGNVKADNCKGIIERDGTSILLVGTTTRLDKPACNRCVNLEYNQRLMVVLRNSITNEYGQTPNALCPSSVVNSRHKNLKLELKSLKLDKLNYERKIGSLN
jgi:hypothetical protein